MNKITIRTDRNSGTTIEINGMVIDGVTKFELCQRTRLDPPVFKIEMLAVDSTIQTDAPNVAATLAKKIEQILQNQSILIQH